MAYASLTDVQDFLPKYEIDTTTSPSSDQVTSYLTTISNRLDGLLASKGYTVPVTSAGGLAILKAIVLSGTGYWVTRVMFPGANSGIVIELYKEYTDWMNMLASDSVTLYDAARGTNILDAQDNFSDPAIASSYAPLITRGQQF